VVNTHDKSIKPTKFGVILRAVLGHETGQDHGVSKVLGYTMVKDDGKGVTLRTVLLTIGPHVLYAPSP